MILLGQFLQAIGGVLNMVLQVFFILFFIRAIASWFSPDPRNPIMQFLYSSTEPILARIRAKVRPIGMFDLSIIVAIIGIYFLQVFLAGSLIKYGQLFASSGSSIVDSL
ncbi:MAG: YggT family protein [bacterium]|nr:YggT family protein [bacterium]